MRLVALLTLALASCTSGAPSPPAPRVEAAPEPPAPSPNDPLDPELVTYADSPGDLRGFLYRPVGTGPFPAVVFNHGSEQMPGPKTDQADFYVAHGYVLFVPHRRGHGRSGKAGEYFKDVWMRSGRAPDVLVGLLEEQVDDVAAAIAYVKSLPEVDRNRVAVAGGSFGGIESLLVAEREVGIRAAIDFAGAAIMWARTPPLQERMKAAARAARVPVFFVQAENDFDTTPSRVLAEEMTRAGRVNRIQIFPPYGTTAMEGHTFCRGSPAPPWGAAVLAFLAETMQ